MARVKLLVVLIVIVISANQCMSMALDEIEDFKDYLRKTSQLDQILKKGTDPEDDYDEEEAISDHAWENSGKFEGDLILNDQQRRLIIKNVAEGLSRNGLKDTTRRWPNNEVVYYIQGEHFNGDQILSIQQGINDIAQASCVKFRPYKKGDRDAVVIQGSRRGCFSQVGYQGGYQIMNLSGRHPAGRGCFRHGTVVHELLHTLGFYHMQSSPDRDDYIDVVWENIQQPARHNFRKYDSFAVSDFGVGYDYESVLHYSRRAFSSNGQDTLIPKQRGAEIGQRIGLSDKDTKKLNRMYCDADIDSPEYEATLKQMLKEKNNKDKPFEGHGIGYHQGKTVVIKLLPTPETYSLMDVPKFHAFDHFSKAPETLSPTEIEGYRVGKKITYPISTHNAQRYMPSEMFDTETNVDYDDNENKHNHVYDTTDPYSLITNMDTDTSHKHHYKTAMYDKDPNSGSEHTDVTDDDLNEAFDRLEKIVTHRVHPAHSSHISEFKNNEGVNGYYTSDISSNRGSLHSLPSMTFTPGKSMMSAMNFINGHYEKIQ